jgi:hypothetical protein
VKLYDTNIIRYKIALVAIVFGSAQTRRYQTKVCHKNFDIDANDQTKQEPGQEIGTENHYEPEFEVTKDGDTFTNKPGDSIGTKAYSPGEGCSDNKSD